MNKIREEIIKYCMKLYRLGAAGRIENAHDTIKAILCLIENYIHSVTPKGERYNIDIKEDEIWD